MARPESFPTAHQLELIAAVADHGGVSAAAESLNISQPAVTAQLRSAEETIGQRLFVRTHTGLVPTAAGRAVAAFARRQISLRRGLMAAMAELSDVFLALPGGYGTWDELFEALTWSQLGIQNKVCGLLNVNGYYDSLIAMVDRAVAEGFIRQPHREWVLSDTDVSRLLDRLNRKMALS